MENWMEIAASTKTDKHETDDDDDDGAQSV